MNYVAIWSGTGRKELLKITTGIFSVSPPRCKEIFFSYKIKERGRKGSRGGRGLKGKRGVAQSWN